MEAILRCLREGGFSAEMAHHAYHALESHIVGFTLWYVGITASIAAAGDELSDVVSSFEGTFPAMIRQNRQSSSVIFHGPPAQVAKIAGGGG